MTTWREFALAEPDVARRVRDLFAAAKVSGFASEVDTNNGPRALHRFVIDVTEVVITRVGTPAHHLVVETSHPGDGLRRIERR